MLLDKRASTNIKDNNGFTPLHIAAQNGHLQVVEFLLEKQAYVDEKDYNGSTPLHTAAENGHLPIGKIVNSQRS